VQVVLPLPAVPDGRRHVVGSEGSEGCVEMGPAVGVWGDSDLLGETARRMGMGAVLKTEELNRRSWRLSGLE